MKKLLLALPVATFALIGCVNERVYVDPDTTSFQGGTPSNLALENGSLRGDFGPRAGFDGSATDMQGTSDPEWQTSTTTISRTENGRGTGMIILWTNGTLLENLEIGQHDFQYDPNSLDTQEVSANVCSGDDSSTMDYDQAAENVSVTVERTPEGRTFDIHTETPTLDAFDNPSATEIETADATFTLLN